MQQAILEEIEILNEVIEDDLSTGMSELFSSSIEDINDIIARVDSRVRLRNELKIQLTALQESQ